MTGRSLLLFVAGFAACGGPVAEVSPDGPAGAADLAAPTVDMGARAADLAGGSVDGAGRGGVGAQGGSVDRLYFAFHGDTRGPNCDDPAGYPSDVIQAIYRREAALGVQLAVDLGDHMNACGGIAGEPTVEMKLYTDAAALLGAPTFMTMGNHECSVKGTPCPDGDPNQAAFLAALAPISLRPYYSVDVKTSTGLATFVFVADNAWDATQSQWLSATLTKADAAAKYTIVMRHHPIDYLKLQAPAEWQIIRQHKYSLFLVSHSHQYLRDAANDPSGRTVVMGCGGAPLEVNRVQFPVCSSVTGAISISCAAES